MLCNLDLDFNTPVKNKIYDVVVVGAGQAGLSISYFLSKSKINHVVLDQGKLGNAWLNDRWDSFCLVTPNWSITLPGGEYTGSEPGAFMSGKDFRVYLKKWATSFNAPVEEHVVVDRITKEGENFYIGTNQGKLKSKQVVIATATYQRPRIPEEIKGLSRNILLLPASDYRNPSTLPAGGVLVIGSGQSGCQIAEELNKSGRQVVLSIGKTGRLPRRYRGADCIEWQKDMGLLDRTPGMLDSPAMRFRGDPHLSGANGGRTLSLHQFKKDGITLIGRITGIKKNIVSICNDCESSLEAADKYASDFRLLVDQYIANTGKYAPQATQTELMGEPLLEDIGTLQNITEIDLHRKDIRTVIAATGFKYDFSWVEPAVLDDFGYPITKRGVTGTPGLYFMGLNWMSKRKSGIIFGVAEDANYLAPIIIGNIGKT